MELFLIIILSIAAQRGPVSDDEAARLHSFAQDIWSTSSESTLMCGPAAQEATAYALLAVAVHESGLWAKVADCRVCYKGSPYCDQGRSISAYQLHVGSGAWLSYSRQEICQDNGLATMLALRVLERHRGSSDGLAVVRGYARGGRRAAAGEMAGIYKSMLSRARLSVVRRDGCLRAERLP